MEVNANVLLVMPRVSYNADDWPVLPIGITYVSAALKKRGLNIYTINLNYEHDDLEKILEENIVKNNISILGTGDLVCNYKAVKEIVDIAKLVKPDMQIFIGGGLVTHSPIDAMKIIDKADFGIIGEGEVTACELIEALQGKQTVETIDGLVYKHGSKYKMTAPREVIHNLDEIPFPDYEGFNYFDVVKGISGDEVFGAITTSRACPFKCTFCSKSGGGSNDYRQRSLDNIFEEVEYVINNYGVNKIFLNDELFTHNAKRINEFCDRIKKYNVEWLVFLRISKFITKDILIKMQESGCVEIFYGVESADDNILGSMKKGITVQEIETCLELTNKVGIIFKANFIFGDVEETSDTVQNTLDWLERQKNLFPIRPALAMIILNPGSKLYHDAVKTGKVKDTVQFIKNGCPLTNVSKMTDEEYVLVQQLCKSMEYQSWGEYEEGTIVGTNGHKYIYSYVCSSCGTENHIAVSVDKLDKRIFFTTCEYCSNRARMHLFSKYLEYIEERLIQLAEREMLLLVLNNDILSKINRFSKIFLTHAESIRLIEYPSNFLGNPINSITDKKICKDTGMKLVSFEDIQNIDSGIFVCDNRSFSIIQSCVQQGRVINFYQIGCIDGLT